LTLDNTDIVKSHHYDQFYFLLFKSGPRSSGGAPEAEQDERPILMYKSRGTILDRPAWRDEIVSYTITSPQDIMTIQIMAVLSKKQLVVN
jgi:hypothetical protein